MKVFNSHGSVDETNGVASIFLAGPTLRGGDRTHYTAWREEALKILEKSNFRGHVYVPEFFADDFSMQIDWEVYHLEKAKCILFWVPRNLKLLPGFTTNIEFGEWMRSGKAVLGTPDDAERVSYMRYRAQKYGVPVLNTLEDTVLTAMSYSQK